MISFKALIRKIHSLPRLIKLKLKEKTFSNQLPYLYLKSPKHSDTLMIFFSAFTGEKRRYNYIKAFNDSDFDRLYILDPWGYKGSYNLYENGLRYPEDITKNLIKCITSKKNYKKVYTLGTSKGGTCAIYFGLELNATAIFAGACQFWIGDYVTDDNRDLIFQGMMGKEAGPKEKEILNQMLQNAIKSNKKSSTTTYLLYSRKDQTYEKHIVDLIENLRKMDITVIEKEDFFERHEDVGLFFPSFVKQIINNK